MRLEQLKYLIAAIRCASLNRAAQELYISQPSLSKSIDALEEELNVRLLLRTPQGTTPTLEGMRVYEDACEIFRIIDSWMDFPSFSAENSGEVHLIGTATFCDFLSGRFTSELHRMFPRLELVLHDAERGDIVRRMLFENYNLGVVSLHSKEDADPWDDTLFSAVTQRYMWKVELLLRDPRVIFVSSHNPLLSRESVSLDDLKTLTLAGYSGVSDENIANHSDLFAPNVLRLHNRSCIFRYVAEDRAAAIFPTITTADDYFVKKGMIRPLPVPDLHLRQARFYLMRPNERALKPAERVVAN